MTEQDHEDEIFRVCYVIQDYIDIEDDEGTAEAVERALDSVQSRTRLFTLEQLGKDNGTIPYDRIGEMLSLVRQVTAEEMRQHFRQTHECRHCGMKDRA